MINKAYKQAKQQYHKYFCLLDNHNDNKFVFYVMVFNFSNLNIYISFILVKGSKVEWRRSLGELKGRLLQAGKA